MIVLVFFLLYPINVISQTISREAISSIQKATLSYPTIRQYKKNAEQKLFNYLSLDKESAGLLGSVVMTGVNGRVGTRPIKNMNLNIMGGKLRPDVLYNFRTKEATGNMNFVIDF